MQQDPAYQEAMEKLQERFGFRSSMLFMQLYFLATSGQPCDVTVYDGSPHIDVKLDPDFAYAVMYGAGPAKLAEMLSEIKLSDGSTISLNEIWTINPMPKGGFTTQQLDEADLSQGNERMGPNGETLIEMIRETYKCKSPEDEEKHLRRWIAS